MIVEYSNDILDGPYSNDIALVLVRAASDSGIVFDSHVRPICLPDGTPTPPPGTWCSVSGWGAQKGILVQQIILLILLIFMKIILIFYPLLIMVT